MNLDSPALEIVRSTINIFPDCLVILSRKGEILAESALLRQHPERASLLAAVSKGKSRSDVLLGLRSTRPIPFRIDTGRSNHNGTTWRLPLPDGKAAAVVRFLIDQPLDVFPALTQQIQRLERHIAKEREQTMTARLFFEQASDGIAILEADGTVLDINRSLLALTASTRTEVVGCALSTIVDFGVINWKAVEATLAHGPIETRLKSKAAPLTVEVSMTPLRLDDKARTIVVVRDLSRTSRYEESLERVSLLQQAFEEARAAEVAKERFFSVVSHELRTPVNALVSAAHLLHEEGELSSRQLELLEAIESASRSALERVNSILGFARFGVTENRMEPFAPYRILETVCRHHQPDAERRGLWLVSEFHGDAASRCVGSPSAIHTILQNLISNALKATKTGGITVQVAINAADDEDAATLHLFVEDTGIGIPVERQRSVFEAFHSGATDGNVSEGTGLGLTIVKRMVDALGGSIELRSEEERGTRFDVSLPVRLSANSEAHGANAAVMFACRNKPVQRVLVVDDHPINRELAGRLLERMGLDVALAVNGLEAVEACAALQPPDLVLMDLNMPVMNGLDATKVIRGTESIEQPIIIGLTAFLDDAIRSRMIEHGMNDALDKPLNVRKLEALIGCVACEANRDAQEPANTEGQVATIMADFKRRALDDFIERFPELERLLTNGKYARAEALAHNLAGSTQLAGLDDIGESLRAIEQELKVGERVSAQNEMRILLKLFYEVKQSTTY